MKPAGNFKHGLHGTRTYRRWKSMKQRCFDTGAVNYSAYGGAGITVCEKWRDSFEEFFLDMGECPEKMTLDRIYNAKGYEPGNCRWATPQEQCNNKTNNHLVEWHGETKTISEWARNIGIPVATLCNRIKNGWSVERALTRKSHETGPLLTYQGETHHLAEWARRMNVRYDLLSRRIAKGWSIEKTLATPSNRAK